MHGDICHGGEVGLVDRGLRSTPHCTILGPPPTPLIIGPGPAAVSHRPVSRSRLSIVEEAVPKIKEQLLLALHPDNTDWPTQVRKALRLLEEMENSL